jgi:plastocyanin
MKLNLKRRIPLFALVALALAVPSFAVAAYATKAAPARAAAAVALTIKSDTQHGKQDTKGVWHDAYLPAAFSVKTGQKVTVTITNYDQGAHTFTAPGLKLNVAIAGAKAGKPSVTTVSFTAPSKAGGFDWFCAAGCDPWAMTHYGYMRGRITVTA